MKKCMFKEKKLKCCYVIFIGLKKHYMALFKKTFESKVFFLLLLHWEHISVLGKEMEKSREKHNGILYCLKDLSILHHGIHTDLKK